MYSTGDTYNIQALAYRRRLSVAITAETITPNQYVLFVILAASQWRLLFIEHFVALLFFLLLLVIAVVIKRHDDSLATRLPHAFIRAVLLRCVHIGLCVCIHVPIGVLVAVVPTADRVANQCIGVSAAIGVQNIGNHRHP